MSSLATLKRIAAGHRPTGEILPSCRMEAGGAEIYSEEAIVEAFRAAPLLLGDEARALETDRHLAVFAGDTVLFADVYGANIARLWRLGPGEPFTQEPSIGVPFDPDLMQARGDLAIRGEDHPQLSAAGADGLAKVGRQLSRDWTPDQGPAPYRVRAFLIRAFSKDDASAGLFALYRMGGGAVRTSGFSYAAALLPAGGGEPLIVRDDAGDAAVATRPWTPRVAGQSAGAAK